MEANRGSAQCEMLIAGYVYVIDMVGGKLNSKKTIFTHSSSRCKQIKVHFFAPVYGRSEK